MLRHTRTGIGVDLSAGALPFEEELVARASSYTVRGIEIPTASPEDLVVMKILASRPRDIADIEGLLVAHPSLDVARVRKHVRLFSAALETPELNKKLEELLRSRGASGTE